MKFIYFYSELYGYYNQHIRKQLSSLFELEAIQINNLKNNSGHTFFGGVSIKIELILQKIKENMGKSILFTDATIFINSHNTSQLVDFFNQYIDYDLCFADNDGHGYYNIGVILIKCNEKTFTFFQRVLSDLIRTRGWDQDIVNKHIQHYTNIKVTTFDKTKIYCNWDFEPSYRDTYLIYKSFIHHDTNIYKNFNKRLDIFKKHQLISDEEYSLYYKKEGI